MNDETLPRPVCERDGCDQPVPESRGTKPRRYCRRSCRQRAYEARKRREEIAAAVGAAVIRERAARAVQKNVTVTPVPAPVERHSDARPAVPAPLPRPAKRGNRLLPPPPGKVRAEPLWSDE